jgi:hypothetical protein
MSTANHCLSLIAALTDGIRLLVDARRNAWLVHSQHLELTDAASQPHLTHLSNSLLT